MESPLRIGDVVGRTGLTAATLRYYEEIGLLPVATRTASGYRTYAEATIDRLTFIGRAKQLGCSLAETAELLTAWDGGACGPIQDRLRTVVAEKLTLVRNQMVDLEVIEGDLKLAAESLERHRPIGACDDSCGCISAVAGAHRGRHQVTIGRKPTAWQREPEIACTMDPSGMVDQLAAWRALLTHVEQRTRSLTNLRLSFDASTPLDELLRLVTTEQSCCSFLRFAITVDKRGVALEIRSSADGLAAVDTLFGTPQQAAKLSTIGSSE